MKAFLIGLALCSVVTTNVSASEDKSQRYHRTDTFLVNTNCTAAFSMIKAKALNACLQENDECEIEDWGTDSSEPVTYSADLANGFKYKCTVRAVAKAKNPDDQDYYSKIGIEGAEKVCHPAAGHFGGLFSRVGLGESVQPFSSCIGFGGSSNMNVHFGVRGTSAKASETGKTPIQFKKMSTCLKTLRGVYGKYLPQGSSVSASGSNFSVTLYCEETAEGGAQLNGVAARF